MTDDQIAGDARQLIDDIIGLALDLRLMLGGDGQDGEHGQAAAQAPRRAMIEWPGGALAWSTQTPKDVPAQGGAEQEGTT